MSWIAHHGQRSAALGLVISHVLDGLQRGSYRGNERLPNEEELGAAVGVSRTPVREAIKVLEAVGVVEVRRGVGTYIRDDHSVALGHLLMFQSQLRETSPRKLYQARLMVEGAAARLVAQDRSDEDLASLRDANARLLAAASVLYPSLDELTTADIAFHNVLYDICGNELIGTLGRFVTALFKPWIRESLRVGGGIRAARNHDVLIAMIELQNKGGAGEATIDQIVEDGLEYWQDSLTAKNPPRRQN